ncbi:hypothetical protein ACJX0J_013013, partial [Zea mays]
LLDEAERGVGMNRQRLCADALRMLSPVAQLPGSKIDGEYDPLMLDLFVYRRAVAPRDTAWESAPLVLHDERLITVRVGWPPHEPEQPRDLVEAVTRILGHHPGPVSSFRLHSSLSPDVDTLGCWMDLLSEKGVAELIIFNLYQDVSTAQLPLQRLKTDILGTMVIGFFNIVPPVLTDNNHWCDGIRNLGQAALLLDLLSRLPAVTELTLS